MISPTLFLEIQARIKTNPSSEDETTLLAEVVRLQKFTTEYQKNVLARLDEINECRLLLEEENERLKKVTQSTYFERDACISLIAQLAQSLGLTVGKVQFETLEENRDGTKSMQTQNRVVVDLPSGQVSWDYLDAEAHLFETLPPYAKALEAQTVQSVYTKVMNPQLTELPSC